VTGHAFRRNAASSRQNEMCIPMSTLRGFYAAVAVMKNGDVSMPLKPASFA
jgi:hypothetical protein